MRFLELVRREIRAVCRLRSPFFYLMVGLPLVYTLLFGYVYKPAVVNRIPTAVYDADNTQISRIVIESYATADKFNVVSRSRSLQEFQEELRSGRVMNGVYIPPNFTRDMKLGKTPHLGVFVDATNLVYGNGALPAHEELAMSMTIKVASKMAEGLSLPPDKALEAAYPVRVQFRILGNPTNSYTNFMLLGMIANSMQIGTFLEAATLLCREYGHIRRIRRYGSALLVGVRGGLTWLTAFVTGMLVIAIGHFHFGVPLAAPLWQFMVLTGAFLFLVVGICLLFSAVFPTQVMASQIPMAYILPGLLYSGMSWPREWAGEFVQFLSGLMPLTYYGEPLRDLSLRGFDPQFRYHVGIMLVSGLVCWLAATAVFAFQRRRYEGQYEAEREKRREMSKKENETGEIESAAKESPRERRESHGDTERLLADCQA